MLVIDAAYGVRGVCVLAACFVGGGGIVPAFSDVNKEVMNVGATEREEE